MMFAALSKTWVRLALLGLMVAAFAVVMPSVIAPSIAHAEHCTDATDGPDCDHSTDPAPTTTTTPTATAAPTDEGGSPGGSSCGIANLGECLVNWTGRILAAVFIFIAQIFGALLGWIGSIFNWAIMVTVFQFAAYFGNSAGMLLAWGVLRDLGNIALLFAFVYIGIETILGIGKHGVEKTLPMLVIFAALMNFSLFAAEAMIDISNAVGSTFYTQAGQVDCRAVANRDECTNQGIAGKVIAASGVNTIFGFSFSSQDMFSGESGGMNQALVAFGILMLMVTMCAVLVAGAVMLIARAITLMLLLVTSPIGFAGVVVPGLSEFSKKWWEMLLDNIFFAPVFVLLMLVGLKIIEGVSPSLFPQGTTLADILQTPGADVGGVFILFSLVIGFMIAALISAKNFGIFGAEVVVEHGLKFITNSAGTFSGLYLAGSAAHQLGKGYNAVARRIPLWAGNPLDRSIAASLDQAQHLKVSDIAGHKTGMESYSEMRASVDKRKESLSKEGKEAKDREDKKNEKASLEMGLRSRNERKVTSAAQKMSFAHMEEYLKNNSAKGVAEHLSTERFSKLMESNELSSDKKKELFNARFSKLRSGISKKDTDAVRSFTPKDIEQFAIYGSAKEFDTLVNHMDTNTGDGLLSASQYKALSNSDKIYGDQKKVVEANSQQSRLHTVLQANPSAQRTQLAQRMAARMGDREYAKSKMDVLKDPRMVASYTPRTLAAIAAERDLQPSDIAAIRNAILNGGNAAQIAAFQAYIAGNSAAAYYWS